MSKHWKEKIMIRNKNGKIIKMQNVSAIFNDVDYYVLFDNNGNFIERGLDFNSLKIKIND